MNKTLNTQLVLEYKLDAEAVDFIERLVAAGHEINLTDGGPQPIFTVGAGKTPISSKTVMEIAKWAPNEHLLIQAFRVLTRAYPNGMGND